MDDLQAIRRLKNGDIGGLEILIARYQAKAVRTAYLVTHDEPMAEEVVQDAFVRFYERARQFDERRAFEPYFLRMVVNAALNAVEKESRRAASLDEDTDTARVGMAAGLRQLGRRTGGIRAVEARRSIRQSAHYRRANARWPCSATTWT